MDSEDEEQTVHTICRFRDTDSKVWTRANGDDSAEMVWHLPYVIEKVRVFAESAGHGYRPSIASARRARARALATAQARRQSTLPTPATGSESVSQQLSTLETGPVIKPKTTAVSGAGTELDVNSATDIGVDPEAELDGEPAAEFDAEDNAEPHTEPSPEATPHAKQSDSSRSTGMATRQAGAGGRWSWS